MILTVGQKKKLRRAAAILFVAVVILVCFFIRRHRLEIASPPDGTMRVIFLDMGQSDATLLVAPDGSSLLIDTGDFDHNEQLFAGLRKAGVRAPDVLLLTHGHSDHVGGAYALLERYRVNTVCTPAEGFLDPTVYAKTLRAIEGERAERREIAEAPMTFSLGEAEITVYPSPVFEGGGNNDSLVVRADYGKTSFLFCGDAEREEEAALLALYGEDAFDADLLKLGHHGSSGSTSDAWLRAVTPDTAVASCGFANEFGHPHAATIRALEERGIELLRTDESGTITIWSDGERIFRAP